MKIGTIFWLLQRKIRQKKSMERERVSELFQNAEPQAARMAQILLIFRSQEAGKIKKCENIQEST
jgi:hypothetical protein